MKHDYDTKNEALVLVFDTDNVFKCCFCHKRLKFLYMSVDGNKETYCKDCDIWWEIMPS